MKKRNFELKSIPLSAMLLALFCLGSLFTFAQSKEKETIVKKKIIVKKIDENGNVTTETIEDVEDINLPEVGLFNRNHSFGLNSTFENKIKKIVVLDENEEIPEDVQKELTAMGLNMSDVKNQFKSAEQGIIIKKAVGKAATIEAYKESSLPGMGFNSFPDNDHDLFDIDMDLGEQGNGIIRLNRNGEKETFKFDGSKIPEELKKKLEESGINLKNLGNGGSWLDQNNGSLNLDGQNFEFHSDDGTQKRRMMIITDEDKMSDEMKNKLEELDIDLSSLKKGHPLSHHLNNNHNFNGCNTTPKVKPLLGVMLSSHEKGAQIDKVTENSAASEAGLQKGDIITNINDSKMTSNFDVIRMVKAHKPGDKIKINYIRDGKSKKTNAVLKAKEIKPRSYSHNFESFGRNSCEDNRFKGSHNFMNHSYSKFEDCEMLCKTPMLGVMIHTEQGGKGASITRVFPNTGAAKAGLKENDLITAIDKTQITGTTNLISTVKQYEPGTKVTIEFLRDGVAKKAQTVISNKAATKKSTTCDCNQKDFKKEADKEIILLKKGKNPLSLGEPAPTNPTPKIRIVQNTLEVSAVALYPNPNNGEFTIDFALEETMPVTLTVLDIAGREVYNKQLTDFNGNHKETIDISDQAPGTYFLTISQGGKLYTKKFVFNNR